MTYEAKLNNAAGKYAEALWKEMQYELVYDNLVEGFIAGAKWAMEQGFTYEAHKGAFGLCCDSCIDGLLDSLQDGEKVIIQIRKKDE